MRPAGIPLKEGAPRLVVSREPHAPSDRWEDYVMNKFAAVAVMASALLGSTAGVRAADVEVIHWWTSGGEQAAVSVFANEFDATGDKWVDNAIALGETARAAIMQRALG